MNALPMNLHPLTGRQIIALTAQTLDVPLEAVYGPSRQQWPTLARHIACHLLRQRRGLSFPQIARMINRQDHTTALHAVNRVQWALDHNRDPIASLYADCLAAVEARS